MGEHVGQEKKKLSIFFPITFTLAVGAPYELVHGIESPFDFPGVKNSPSNSFCCE